VLLACIVTSFNATNCGDDLHRHPDYNVMFKYVVLHVLLNCAQAVLTMHTKAIQTPTNSRQRAWNALALGPSMPAFSDCIHLRAKIAPEVLFLHVEALLMVSRLN
jgi:hypothetical protein